MAFVMGVSILNLISGALHVLKKLLSILLKLQTAYQVHTLYSVGRSGRITLEITTHTHFKPQKLSIICLGDKDFCWKANHLDNQRTCPNSNPVSGNYTHITLICNSNYMLQEKHAWITFSYQNNEETFFKNIYKKSHNFHTESIRKTLADNVFKFFLQCPLFATSLWLCLGKLKTVV